MTKNKILAIFCVLIITFLWFFSCSGPGTGDHTSKSQVLTKINIPGALSLTIIPDPSSDEGGNLLYKITSNNLLLKVDYLDQNDTSMSVSINPQKIFNINSTYIIITFIEITDGEYNNKGFLVRKTDGAIFALPDKETPVNSMNGPFRNTKVVQTDGAGNIYYPVSYGKRRIVKLNISDPSSIVRSWYTNDVDTICSYVITTGGDVGYIYGTGMTNRIQKSNGGLYNLPDYGWMPIWIGLDGKIKFRKSGDAPTVYTVNIDASFDVSFTSKSGTLSKLFQGLSADLMQFSTRTVAAETLNGYVMELENPTNTPRDISIPSIKKISITGQSATHYYLSGTGNDDQPILIKVNPATDAATTLLPKSGAYYDIFKMAISADNVVQFNAIRMFDGKKVIGSIDATGDVTIIDEVQNQQVVVLERIN